MKLQLCGYALKFSTECQALQQPTHIVSDLLAHLVGTGDT